MLDASDGLTRIIVKPASRNTSANRRPDQGVSVADLNTTVLPVTSAAATGPPASANGKLNGAITTHAPYGRITLRLREVMPSIGSFGSG